MTTNSRMVTKMKAAVKLIEGCISPEGVGIWASRERYAHQCWTRDFVLAAAPALRLMGREDVVSAQMTQLIAQQDANGKVPILYLDDPVAFLKAKIDRSIQEGKWSFMLKQFFEPGSVENLSPWTKDSEFLFAIALLEHADVPTKTDKGLRNLAIWKALTYVSEHLMADGLVLGADWRDTNTWLHDAALLSNNCLLFHAFQHHGWTSAANELKEQINRAFWTGTGYRDYLGVESADTFGQALGVIHGVIPPDRYQAVLESFARLHTPRGYLSNNCRPNPTTPEERKLLRLKRMKQSFVIWPFIHGYAVLALLKMGEPKLAERAFREYTDLNGFWEYYDPETGKGYGAKEQLWSAALYLSAANALGHNVQS